ncbi:MAG: CDP-alcohol phosphatidyltransferase family protein [Chlamydiota bacterium]
MIDSFFRTSYQRLIITPILNRKAMRLLSPNSLTIGAALFGIAIPFLLFFSHTYFAFFALLLSGFCDTLDGSLARSTGKTSATGAMIDILSDRLVEFSVIFGLYLVNPNARSAPALAMLGAVLMCITSFLVVGIFEQNYSNKSFHYSPGLIERAEAFVFFAAMLLFPALFSYLAYLFTSLVFTTAILRAYQFATKVAR